MALYFAGNPKNDGGWAVPSPLPQRSVAGSHSRSDEPHGTFLLYKEAVCDTMTGTRLGAQTERRADAGPVRGLLGGKASPAAFCSD
jgi:hypothetical protein